MVLVRFQHKDAFFLINAELIIERLLMILGEKRRFEFRDIFEFGEVIDDLKATIIKFVCLSVTKNFDFDRFSLLSRINIMSFVGLPRIHSQVSNSFRVNRELD